VHKFDRIVNRERIYFSALVFTVGLLPACSGGSDATADPASTDPVVVDSAHYSVIVDNPAVRILKVSYGAGERSTAHQHPDAIAVSLSGGTFRFELPDGTTRDASLAAGEALYTPAETHNPENVGSATAEVILVEFKTAAPGTAALPASREGMGMTMLAEGPRATAYRVTADTSFAEPEGTTHDYDQVVIALGPAEVELRVDGMPPRSTWARGDVAFIGRGAAHASTNRGGTAADYVLIAIK
jgi:quercetin dioxygenase-like cupin family protein